MESYGYDWCSERRAALKNSWSLSGNGLKEPLRRPETEPCPEIGGESVVVEVARRCGGRDGLADGGSGLNVLQQGVLDGRQRIAPHDEIAAEDGHAFLRGLGDGDLLAFSGLTRGGEVGVDRIAEREETQTDD